MAPSLRLGHPLLRVSFPFLGQEEGPFFSAIGGFWSFYGICVPIPAFEAVLFVIAAANSLFFTALRLIPFFSFFETLRELSPAPGS